MPVTINHLESLERILFLHRRTHRILTISTNTFIEYLTNLCLALILTEPFWWAYV